MAKDKSPVTLIAERFNDTKARIAERVAEVMRPVYGNVTISKREQRARFWQVEKGWTPEKERLLLTGLNPDGTPALGPDGQPAKPRTPQQVGLLKYPHREIDAKAGGRAFSLKAQADYMREMAELGPPEPDGLELAALQMQPQSEMAPVAAPEPVMPPAPMPVAPMQPPAGVPPMMPMGQEGAV